HPTHSSSLPPLSPFSFPSVLSFFPALTFNLPLLNIDDESQTRGHSSGTWLIAPEGDWTLCLNVTPTSIECQVANACLSPKGEFEYLQ
ncbi:hypothetical protein M8360_32415, partial [Klebsiella pneumoniae]|nr:hypothetical protein [Klebsiella pneumoniae]